MNKKIIFTLLMLSVVLVSGCVQLDVEQKIKRNGNVDLSLIVKSESPTILNALKQNLEVAPSVQNKYTYEESDNSVTYKFTDIDPTKDVLFKESEDSDMNTSMLFNKDNYNFKKEFRFPYYYYTYKIVTEEKSENTNSDIEENNLLKESEIDTMFGDMFKIGYTLEVFGKIVETNGNRMDDNKVKFNIGLEDNKVYYVEFKDFFISNWLGSLF